jgi:putative SOS response-associated peptidase YedK
MCGRYRLSRRKQLVEEYFDSVSEEEDWNPRYNIAPTQPIPVIRQNAKEPVRELSLIRWGLIPSWAKDPSVAAKILREVLAPSTDALAIVSGRVVCSNCIPRSRLFRRRGNGKIY